MIRKLIAKAGLAGLIGGAAFAGAVTIMVSAFLSLFFQGTALTVVDIVVFLVAFVKSAPSAGVFFAILEPGGAAARALGVEKVLSTILKKSGIVGAVIAGIVTAVTLVLALLLNVSGVALAFVLTVTFLSWFIPVTLVIACGGAILAVMLELAQGRVVPAVAQQGSP